MLTKLLVKLFGPPRDNTDKLVTRSAIGRLEAWVSIVINSVLASIKLALGIVTNSLALIADAIHTASDVATSIVVIFGFTISGKPADKEHPFGHGRAEYVATLVIAIMLGVVGFEFIKAAGMRFLNPEPLFANWTILIAIIVTILIKYRLGSFARELGRMIDSSTLEADAKHHMSDALSSIVVLAAVAGSAAGYPSLDSLAGILIGLYLIWSGFDIAREAINPLLGEPPAPELVYKIRELCRSQENIFDAHDIVVHNYGHHMFIGLHAEVSVGLSVQEAHDIAEDLGEYLQTSIGAYTTVHIDPIDPNSSIVKQVSDYLDNLLKDCETIDDYHDLRVVETPQHKSILLDVATNRDSTRAAQQAAIRWLSRELSNEFPGSTIEIQMAPLHSYY